MINNVIFAKAIAPIINVDSNKYGWQTMIFDMHKLATIGNAIAITTIMDNSNFKANDLFNDFVASRYRLFKNDCICFIVTRLNNFIFLVIHPAGDKSIKIILQ